MKSPKPYSPVLKLQPQTHLVPLKQKFSKTQVKEVPGWRLLTSTSPTSIKITPSKLSQVKSKRDFHSTLFYATDERLPQVLKSASHKLLMGNSKNFNKKTLEVPDLNLDTQYGSGEKGKYSKKLKPILERQGASFIGEGIGALSPMSSPLHLDPIHNPKLAATPIPSLHHSPEISEKFSSFSPSLSTKLTSTDRFGKESPSYFEYKTTNSSNSFKVLLRRRSENFLKNNQNSRLQNKKNTQVDLKFSRSKSFSSQSDSETSESLSSESFDNPVQEIADIRDNLGKRTKNSGNRQSRYLYANDFDRLNNSRRSSSFQNSSLSKSSNSRSNFEELTSDDPRFLKIQPRKSQTKNINSNVHLLPESSIRRSVTDNLYTIPHSKKFEQLSINENENENPNESFTKSSKLQSHFKSQNLGKASLHNDKNEKSSLNTLKNPQRPSHLYTSLSPSQTLRKSINNPSTKTTSNSQRPSRVLSQPPTINPESRPSRNLDHAQSSLWSPKSNIKKSPTLNLDSNDKTSKPFKLKKFNSEKPNQNMKNNKIGRVTFKNQSSDEENVKMMIKITEAPDMETSALYNNENFLVTMNSEKKNYDDDHNYLNTFNPFGKHKGKKSDLPSRSRASSHEWSKESYNNELGKNRPDLKKISRKTEAYVQDMSKKYSNSPRLSNRNDSDEDSDDIYSMYSNESGHSKRSGTKRPTDSRKFTKKPSNPPIRKSTFRNPASLKFLKTFIVSEVQKKLGTLDPVTNFLYNFSFSILKCIQTLAHISLLRRNSKIVQRMPTAKRKLLDPTEKDSLFTGKLKVNKMKGRESKFFSTLVVPMPRRNSKKRKEVKELKASRTIRNKNLHGLGKGKENVLDIKEGNEDEDSSSSDGSSSSSSSQNPDVMTRTRKSILYELAKQELTLQIARQILEGKDEDEKEELDQSKFEEESNDDDLDSDLIEFTKKLKSSPSHFAFGPEINFKQIQKNLMFFSFKELEEGCYEIDADNLIRESDKKKFLDRKKLEQELENFNKKNVELQIHPDGNMTEEQMYRARIQKVKIVGKKLKKRREKLESLAGNVQVLGSITKAKKLNIDFDKPSFGDTFDERVYFRLKGSASPIIIKR